MRGFLLGILCILQIIVINEVSCTGVRRLTSQSSNSVGCRPGSVCSKLTGSSHASQRESTTNIALPVFIFKESDPKTLEEVRIRRAETLVIGTHIIVENESDDEVYFRIVSIKSSVSNQATSIKNQDIDTEYVSDSIDEGVRNRIGIISPSEGGGPFYLISQSVTESLDDWKFEAIIKFNPALYQRDDVYYIPEIVLLNENKSDKRVLPAIAVWDVVEIKNDGSKKYDIAIREIQGDDEKIERLSVGTKSWKMKTFIKGIKVRDYIYKSTIYVSDRKTIYFSHLGIKPKKGKRYGLFKQGGTFQVFVQEIKFQIDSADSDGSFVMVSNPSFD